MGHAKLPWAKGRVFAHLNHIAVEVIDFEGYVVGHFVGSTNPMLDTYAGAAQLNANIELVLQAVNNRRVAACLRACEGLSTEELEVAPGYKAAIEGFHEQVALRSAALTQIPDNWKLVLTEVISNLGEHCEGLQSWDDVDYITEQLDKLHALLGKDE